jgi:hypothetical protein
MTRRPSVVEILLGGSVVALVGFVASQAVTSPHKLRGATQHSLTGRDSASIAAQYRSQVMARRGAYAVPAWLSEVQIARLQAAADRDVAGRDSVTPLSPDSLRALLAVADQGTYLRAIWTSESHAGTA